VAAVVFFIWLCHCQIEKYVTGFDSVLFVTTVSNNKYRPSLLSELAAFGGSLLLRGRCFRRAKKNIKSLLSGFISSHNFLTLLPRIVKFRSLAVKV